MTALETARQIWATFTDDERALVKLAMFPAGKMEPQVHLTPDQQYAVTIALMHISTGKEKATA